MSEMMECDFCSARSSDEEWMKLLPKLAGQGIVHPGEMTLCGFCRFTDAAIDWRAGYNMPNHTLHQAIIRDVATMLNIAREENHL